MNTIPRSIRANLPVLPPVGFAPQRHCVACTWRAKIREGREHELLCVDHYVAWRDEQRPLAHQARILFAEHRPQLARTLVWSICTLAGGAIMAAVFFPVGLLFAAGVHP